jgi:6-phosphogluconolactonase
MNDGRVYAQTNDAAGNQVIAYSRAEDGSLSQIGSYDTGGHGTGKPHLPSQGSIVLSDDGRRLIVANAGSDDVSVFEAGPDGLALVDRTSSGGRTPTSVAVHGSLVYVLNNGSSNVTGFRIGSDGKLAPLPDSARPLSDAGADPAQIAFSPDGRTLVVTERGTNSIAAYAIDGEGYAEGPAVHASSGATPYGFDFTEEGHLVVTEAFGGEIGAAAASSYALPSPAALAPLSASVGDTRSEVCWAVVSKNGRFAYVTNFGDGTISSYAIEPDGRIELLDPVAATTVEGEKGVRDEALSSDGRYLYALDADARKVFGWHVRPDGSLAPVGAADGLPATVAGLAAS